MKAYTALSEPMIENVLGYPRNPCSLNRERDAAFAFTGGIRGDFCAISQLIGVIQYGRGSQRLHSKVRIGIIINVKRSKIIVITKLVYINMLITLYNNST